MNYSSKIGEMNYDGLISDITPAAVVTGAIIRKESAEKAVYARGTVFAKSSVDSKLVILGTAASDGETLEAYAILTDDVEVDASADVSATFYIAGCFDLAKCAVKTDYAITEADKDALRKYGIIFKNASASS